MGEYQRHAACAGKAILVVPQIAEGNREYSKTAFPTNQEGRSQDPLCLREVPGGIWVMDQWKDKNKVSISSRFIRALGQTKSGAYLRPSDNADAYAVIE